MTDLPGARHVELDGFGAERGRELFAGIVRRRPGRGRAGGGRRDPALCGYLPLAIRIAGARLAGRQAWRLRVMRDRLADESNRLGELRVGELGVRASFELSMRHCRRSAVRAFAAAGPARARKTCPAGCWPRCSDRPGRAPGAGHAGRRQPGRAGRHRRQRAAAVPAARPAALLRGRAGRNPSPRDRRDALTRLLSALLALAEQAAANLPAAVRRGHRARGRWQLDAVTARRVVADPLAWFDAERGLLSARSNWPPRPDWTSWPGSWRRPRCRTTTCTATTRTGGRATSAR